MRSRRQFAIFLTIVVCILATWHFYLWERLVLESELAKPLFYSLTTLFIVAPLSIIGYFLLDTPKIYNLLVSWWMGFSFLLLTITGFVDLTKLAGFNPEARTKALVIITIAFFTTLRGIWNAFRPVVKHTEVILDRLPKSFDGFKIAQLSDIHIGPTLNEDFLAKLVDKVLALKPDLIAVTGDTVDGTVAEIGDKMKPFERLRAPKGTFYVTGNHEYFYGAEDWVTRYKELGLNALRNSHEKIQNGKDHFYISGVNDISSRDSSVKKAFDGIAEDDCKILLAHQPKTFKEAQSCGVDLQLSGHTHGGQIFPFGFFAWLDSKFLAGLHSRGKSKIYVSRGNGFWGPPIRIGAPSEITLLTLRCSS